MLIADKGYDADARVLEPLGATLIPLFAKLKHFRLIATRYGKTARKFLAAVNVAASASCSIETRSSSPSCASSHAESLLTQN